MDRKNIIIIAVVAIAIIAVGAAIYTSLGSIIGNDGLGDLGTTPFKTEFMEGSFAGKNVKLVNDSEAYMHSYEDKEHGITYNISTVDNSTALMDIYYVQGVRNPEHRNFNGNDWNIYFTEAVAGNNTNNTDDVMTIVICQSQKEKQGYFIYAIFDANSTVNTTVNTYGDSYTKFVEPLLKSITLKESSNVPTVSSQFGLTDDQFAQQMELIQQYKAGNTSALEGAQ